MKSLIRFVLILAVGMLLGYLLSPTIDGLVKGSKVENLANEGSKVLNETAQEQLAKKDSTENEK